MPRGRWIASEPDEDELEPILHTKAEIRLAEVLGDVTELGRSGTEGMCTRAADEIEKLRAANRHEREERGKLHSQIARLRAGADNAFVGSAGEAASDEIKRLKAEIKRLHDAIENHKSAKDAFNIDCFDSNADSILWDAFSYERCKRFLD